MNIAVVGTGYVGLVTVGCLAKLGHKVTGIDNDKDKIAKLKQGKIPIFEPGLDKLIKAGTRSGKVSFTDRIEEGIKSAKVIFICVNTPPRPDGSADLSYVENVCRAIAASMTDYKLIVSKSTVPVRTGEKIKQIITLYNRSKVPFDVASNPEFLREGSAVQDFLKPDRIVLGVENKRAEKTLLELYKKIRGTRLIANIATAELIKHASNSFLAMKVSYINMISRLCEKVGADVDMIADGMGFDPRIGRAFLNTGPGYGGFCLPKDVEAFARIGEDSGCNFNLLKAVKEINEQQKLSIVQKIEDALRVLKGKTIGVLGLAFKPNTDDIRFSPSLDIIAELIRRGAKVRAYDPKAMEKVKNSGAPFLHSLQLCDNVSETARNTHGLVLLTDWPEFRRLNIKGLKRLMATPVFIDARNMFEPERFTRHGFVYRSVGRK